MSSVLQTATDIECDTLGQQNALPRPDTMLELSEAMVNRYANAGISFKSTPPKIGQEQLFNWTLQWSAKVASTIPA